VLNVENKNSLKISNDTLKIRVNKNHIGDYVIATSNEAYAIQAQWRSPGLEDVYRIHLPSNEIVKIKSALAFGGSLSPKGRYYAYFNHDQKQHFLVDMQTQAEICVTCEVKNVNWQEDVNGQPLPAGPIDDLQYLAGEEEFVVLSEFDIWKYSLKTQKITCLSDNGDFPRKTRFSLNKWSADSVYIDWKNTYAKGFNTLTKSSSIFTFDDHNGHLDFKEVYAANYSINTLLKSKNGKRIILRKMDVGSYPEISVLDSLFNDEKIISKTNPQQSEYNWATVDLIKWKAYDGSSLEGLVYKPEDFDQTKKYPLIVYYYELNSDNLHNHNAPRPSASTINPVEYASAGYIVFIPDIRYKVGFPAKSAFNCIMSGTDYLLKMYPVDSFRMGLQGQSWGGYQTAQLITMTPRYAAAMAGAPVANMVSAYGGIRWGSGLNRQFQYESTQSRIGKTIWEAQESYIENSPIFHLPNVSTPLLIMHNDKDGAVPWYQGIELYSGMRRLNKPCWLLNYNDDDHNLTKLANKIDLSIRMRQFFGHFLMNDPAPTWMLEGVKATDKGKITGY
jgi:dipeptidyl aminopeptidase/acylaminoacyl peptidase